MSVFIKQSVTSQAGFKPDSGWVILSPIEAAIKRKIEAVGTPLKDWDISIYRGILTGYNEAFIIDGKTKDALIATSPKNAEIIRPIVLGRNIKRYNYKWEGLWLINSHNGIKGQLKGINIQEDYSTIYEYLKTFLPQIQLRADQGSDWTNLRNCAYLSDFDKPKIAWGNLGLKGQFAFIEEPMIINAPSPFFATDNTYLLAILNSRISDFYIKQLGVTRSGGYFEYKPMFIEQLPIPEVSKDEELYFKKMVKEIQSCSDQEKEKLDLALEAKIADLYQLSEEEKAIIYGKA